MSQAISSPSSDRQSIAGLRKSLVLLFLAMSLPVAALIWHAYGQLKWESFHQYRTFAEELSNRIDANLGRLVAVEQRRPVSDYEFAVPGRVDSDRVDPDHALTDRFQQLSPLSVFPLTGDLPGTLGYFQIDASGRFTSPVLPSNSLDPAVTGIDAQELQLREELAQQLQSILAENRLLDSAAGSVAMKATNETQAQTDSILSAAPVSSRESAPSTAPVSQIAFDNLSVNTANSAQKRKVREKNAAVGSVSGLKLDSDLELKSESYEKESRPFTEEVSIGTDQETRSELMDQADDATSGDTGSLQESLLQSIGNGADPIEFSMLDSGHFILFRRVWNEQERLIQGLLLEQAPLLDSEVNRAYRHSRVSGMSDLVVAFRDDVLTLYQGGTQQRYSVNVDREQETLLYRRSLSAPLGAVELIYTVRHLPPGPGASVLSWSSLAVTLVLLGGFYGLYKLGLKQIALATQQRNFVSSVSHELKTPLTSIRMYSEMLKSGWATEDKKHSYYEYIHDESERLSRLISNVLKLSNMHNNELDLDLQPVNLALMMQLAEARIVAQFAQSEFSLGFTVELGINDKIVLVDEDSFMQVMINLVDNAIKFSRSAGKKNIDIHCRILGDSQVCFSVRDYGPGIPRDHVKDIFKLFYRPRNELTRDTVGTGIGLSIVHQLVDMMQGSVDVVNMDPGAEFRIILPVSSSEPPD